MTAIATPEEGLADVIVQVAVLLGVAVVLLSLAVFRFRRAIAA